jgi:hypothetical protein
VGLTVAVALSTCNAIDGVCAEVPALHKNMNVARKIRLDNFICNKYFLK